MAWVTQSYIRVTTLAWQLFSLIPSLSPALVYYVTFDPSKRKARIFESVGERLGTRVAVVQKSRKAKYTWLLMLTELMPIAYILVCGIAFIFEWSHCDFAVLLDQSLFLIEHPHTYIIMLESSKVVSIPPTKGRKNIIVNVIGINKWKVRRSINQVEYINFNNGYPIHNIIMKFAI